MIRDDRIEAMYKGGENPKTIATLVGVSWPRIYQVLRSRGVTRSPADASRRYQLDETYFDELDSERAYWLGFILADGCVTDSNHLKVCLARKDREHLEKLRAAMKSTAPICETSKETVTLTLCSKRLCERLKALGVTPRKSSRHGVPPVRHSLFAALFLGYFDGDGCIYRAKKQGVFYGFHVIGPTAFCGELAAWITVNTKARVHVRPSRCRGMANVTGGTEAVLRILGHMYKRSPVRLERKHTIFVRAVNEHHHYADSKIRTRIRGWTSLVRLANEEALIARTPAL